MNGAAPRSVTIPLSFLKPGQYQSTEVRDRVGQTGALDIGKGLVTRGDSIRLDLLAGGGFVGRFLR
jgi:alpha-glucosidase